MKKNLPTISEIRNLQIAAIKLGGGKPNWRLVKNKSEIKSILIDEVGIAIGCIICLLFLDLEIVINYFIAINIGYWGKTLIK